MKGQPLAHDGLAPCDGAQQPVGRFMKKRAIARSSFWLSESDSDIQHLPAADGPMVPRTARARKRVTQRSISAACRTRRRVNREFERQARLQAYFGQVRTSSAREGLAGSFDFARRPRRDPRGRGS